VPDGLGTESGLVLSELVFGNVVEVIAFAALGIDSLLILPASGTVELGC
jgi:hypothetical protein